MKDESRFPLAQMPKEVGHLKSLHLDLSSSEVKTHRAPAAIDDSDHMASTHFPQYLHKRRQQVFRHLKQ
jgi:hypothetical protein